ncbi:hypothetical protein PKOR_00940 [Pontibacter korlensis]|uniref:Transposase n=1 Tax=Pontibacter korlensis TaxID=400092 RepID=A0A0E3ZCP0_9BACT|nr:hypothetical protein PKOR_00940 [Pontibacter korlensis]
MHLPAFTVVRYKEPVFTALYERLVKRGKTKMQAYVAVQRRLLVLLWTLWRKNEAYDARYGQQPAEPKNNIQIQEAGASLSGVSAADKDAITQETQPETAEKEIAPAQARATQDELPVPVGPGALFQVE